MTVFNTEKNEQGDWFPFFGSTVDVANSEIVYHDPEPDAAEFRIRPMGPFWAEHRKGRKREYKMALNPRTHAMERVPYYPDLPPEEEAKANDDAWDYCITGFKNAFSRAAVMDGEKVVEPAVPLECTRENKLALVEIPAFNRYIQRVFLIQSEAGIGEQEVQEKN